MLDYLELVVHCVFFINGSTVENTFGGLLSQISVGGIGYTVFPYNSHPLKMTWGYCLLK